MRYNRLISQSLSRRFTPIYQNPNHIDPNLPILIRSNVAYYSSYILENPNLIKPNFESSHNLNIAREFTSSAQESKPAPSGRVLEIVDEISGLTLLEVADLTEVLRKKMGIEEMPVMAMMMPGMGFAGMRGGGKGGGAGAKEEEKKVEKTAFDLKLEGGYDAGAKIKIIKEVRACTDLGLKEAKDLVEKAPTLLKKGVTKEEAEKIMQKMKDAGAKVTME